MSKMIPRIGIGSLEKNKSFESNYKPAVETGSGHSELDWFVIEQS